MTQQTTNISRRGFLTLGGLTALGGAAALAGCAPQTAADKKLSGTGTGTSAADVDFEEEYDVVVVGAGIAGITSAITVSREGAGASCLVIEEEAAAAGCSPVCAGDFLGRDDEYEYPVQYLKDMATTASGQTIPDDVLEAFAAGINENLEWVLSLGATMDMLDTKRTLMEDLDKAEYREFASAVAPEYSFDDNAQPPFNHLHNFLTHICVDECTEAVELRFNTPLEDLVRDGDGRVVGVIADGHAIKANKGVIMCCGGYEHNEEFLEGFCGVGNAISFAMEGNTGDGHKICARHGADFWHMHNAAGFWMAGRNLDNTAFSNGALASHKYKCYGITVGKNGRRFYMDWDGHKSLDVSNDAADIPRDDLSRHVGSRHGVMQFGGEWNHLPMPSVGWFVFDSDNYERAFDFEATKTTDPVADGWLYKADTLEDLAAQMEVPPEELTATVAQWNEFCERGADMAFYRPADTLTPIKTAPFYAQRCNPAMLNTDGGPKRAADGAILDCNGEKIPGLYAAGEFGSVWGYLYQGNGNVGEAMAFGRISARSCLA